MFIANEDQVDKYYKCNNINCIDNKYLVWYPHGNPIDPTCNGCNIAYEQKYNNNENRPND